MNKIKSYQRKSLYKSSLFVCIIFATFITNNLAFAYGKNMYKNPYEKNRDLKWEHLQKHRSIKKALKERKAIAVKNKINDVIILTNDKDKFTTENELLKKYIKKILVLDKIEDIQKYVFLINKIPGYQAEFELEPVQGNSLMNLVLKINRTRGKVEFDVNDYGSKNLGKYQFSVSSQLYNPTKSNDSLILYAGTSNKWEALKTITVGYLKRLNSLGTSASVFGIYSENNPYYKVSGSKNSSNCLVKGLLRPLPFIN